MYISEMKLFFDAKGYLTPYTIIECDILTLKTYFVDAFPSSSIRQDLWGHYEEYVTNLQNEVTKHFIQWLNGSFFTQIIDPKDIDLVTFIDAQTFANKEKILENYWSFALEDKGLDAYIVEIYPLESTESILVTESLRNVWRNRFGKDRNNYSKGFIQVTY